MLVTFYSLKAKAKARSSGRCIAFAPSMYLLHPLCQESSSTYHHTCRDEPHSEIDPDLSPQTNPNQSTRRRPVDHCTYLARLTRNYSIALSQPRPAGGFGASLLSIGIILGVPWLLDGSKSTHKMRRAASWTYFRAFSRGCIWWHCICRASRANLILAAWHFWIQRRRLGKKIK